LQNKASWGTKCSRDRGQPEIDQGVRIKISKTSGKFCGRCQGSCNVAQEFHRDQAEDLNLPNIEEMISVSRLHALTYKRKASTMVAMQTVKTRIQKSVRTRTAHPVMSGS
jgi:hypothetical protein